MKLKIQGTEYSVDGLSRIGLFDILELKRQTGMTVDELQDRLTVVVSDADGDADQTAAGLLGDESGILALAALIWLTRRKAGESLTLEQACDFPLEELEIVAEDGDVVDTPDPQ